MDVRRRISFNMNTGGGQPSEPSTGGTYTVNLNSQWEKTTVISNPDSTLYDGVYRSSSSYNVNNGVSTMYIDISGYSEFTLYIRSYAESSYDYVMVSELDKTITSGSSTTDTTLVKAHTKGNQKSGTTISDYTEVKYTNIDGGSHRITILYRKDGSVNSGDDRGYVLIKKQNVSGGGDTPDNPGTGGDTSGPINTSNYMTILALEDGLTASLSTNACQYCIDGDGNWIDLPSGTTTQSINSGQTLSFKGNLTPKSSSGIGTFTISTTCNLEGNCMSLLFGDDAMNNYSLSGKSYAFYNLFSECTTIIQVSESFLPATTLASHCYGRMFQGCTSLTTAPELPATTLASNCYNRMFCDCRNLIVAPELPATKLANYCYNGMFYGCTSLTTAPELPATKLATYCYNGMFRDCTSLTVAPELPATTLASYCYEEMFYGCTSLTTAPELPATTLASNCYYSMFYGTNVLPDCSNIKFSSTSVVSSGGLRGLFAGTKVTDGDLERILPKNSNGKYCLPATTLASSCYKSMFQGCTRLTTAPELPATTLTNWCYSYMFEGCRNLNYIKMLATDISATNCLDKWVSNVSSTGTFVKNPAMTSLPTGQSGIPSGWTVYNDGEEPGGGSSLTFPVTIVEGDNGQLGIDLYNYLSEAYPNTESGPQIMSETIIISNGSLENKIGSTPSHVRYYNGEIHLSDNGADYYYLSDNGYLYAYED